MSSTREGNQKEQHKLEGMIETLQQFGRSINIHTARAKRSELLGLEAAMDIARSMHRAAVDRLKAAQTEADAANWCEHSVKDGEYCKECNDAAKQARADAGEQD
jgi:hypothetical protein